MEALATGSWLTRERVIRVAFLFALASFLSIAALFATAHGTLDYQGRPLGTDFSNVWAAGKMALEGAAAKAWSWPDHFAVQRLVHHKADVDVFGWHYPPPFLLVAAALASIPYLKALILWQLATLVPFTAFMWRLVPRRETILGSAQRKRRTLDRSGVHQRSLRADRFFVCAGAVLDRDYAVQR